LLLLWVALSDETAIVWKRVLPLFVPFESADWQLFLRLTGSHVPLCDVFCGGAFPVAYCRQEQIRYLLVLSPEVAAMEYRCGETEL